MNNKSNIFEELNKMKSLIHAKSGTVISEQSSANQLLVSGKGFGPVDAQMADRLVKLGNITQSTFLTQSQISSLRDQARKELETDNDNDDKRKENIKLIYCSVKDGIITNSGSVFKGKPFEEYRTSQNVTGLEIADAAKSCPANKDNKDTGYKFGDDLSKALELKRTGNTQKGNTNSRFTKSAESLGLKNGKMDLQTLQAMLKALEGEQQTTTTSSTTQGSPDLTQLTNMLTQL